MRQASRHLSQLYNAALAPVGISVNQYAMLVRTGRSGPCSIRELAATLVMDRSTLGHLLRPLEARGLVVLAASPADRRRRLLSLTPAGAALLETARPHWAAAQHRFAAAYGHDAAGRLRSMLGDVVALRLEPAAAESDTPSPPLDV